MDEREYLQHDGLALGELVAKGEVTAAELLDAARTRARAVNPAVNAICTWLDDAADERFYVRQEAAEDAWLARQDEQRRNRPRLPDPWGHDNKEENR